MSIKISAGDLEKIAAITREFVALSEIEQGYIKVEFDAHSFGWGNIRFRFRASGEPDGERSFRGAADLLEELEELLDRAKTRPGSFR